MRYLITFSYDGSKYNGYQKQPDKRTIQGELENVLTKLNHGEEVHIVASGRTDAGVHANNQKAHFDLMDEFDIEKLRRSLNKMISKDIYIKNIKKVGMDFHARFDVVCKEYCYKINMGDYNPIEKDYVLQYNKKLDTVEMERALKYLEGTHNFKSFAKASDKRDTYERTIIQANLIRDHKDINHISIVFLGTGFLRYMVRNLVGTLIEIGEGKRKSEEIISILKSEDRKNAGKTAPACGLYLNDVIYR